MPSSSFPIISVTPLDSDNTNRIATMKNIQVVYTTFNAYGSRITTLENNYGTTSSAQTNLGNRVTTLENNYGSMNTTLTNLNTNYNNLSTTVSNQGNSITTLQNNLSTTNSNVTTANNNITTNTNNITTLQNNYGSLSTTVSNQGSTLSTATSNISTLQGQVSTLQGKVRYDITTFSSGTCLASERISDFTAAVAFSLPASLTGSVAKARIAPAAAFVLSVRKNGTQFATINFAANATSGTFTAASATSFAVGDQIDILAQSALDSLSDISITLVGTR